MTALAVMGLLPAMGQVCGGAIRFKGEDLVTAGETRMRQIRGRNLDDLPGTDDIAEPALHHRAPDRQVYSAGA